MNSFNLKQRSAAAAVLFCMATGVSAQSASSDLASEAVNQDSDYDNSVTVSGLEERGDYLVVQLPVGRVYRLYQYNDSERVELRAEFDWSNSQWIAKSSLCAGECEQRSTTTDFADGVPLEASQTLLEIESKPNLDAPDTQRLTAGYVVDLSAAPTGFSVEAGSDDSGNTAAPLSFDIDSGNWLKDAWSHDFDSVDDLEYWHAQAASKGARDPDVRQIGKQDIESKIYVTNEFKEVVDVIDGNLVMRSIKGEESVNGRTQSVAKMALLKSFADFNTIDQVGWADASHNNPPGNIFPTECTNDVTPCDFLIDPAQDTYIETRVKLSGAAKAFKSWWAFWLFSPSSNYHCENGVNGKIDDVIATDPPRFPVGSVEHPEGCFNSANRDGKANTGMEVDILEYVPYVVADGFNQALFLDGNKSKRPGGDQFTADEANTHDFLYANNSDYKRDVDNGRKKIGLDDGEFHTIGMLYTSTLYAFYIDGYRIWFTDESEWVTDNKRMGIQLSWEKDEGTVLEDADGDGVYAQRWMEDRNQNGIQDWREPPAVFRDLEDKDKMSYGPWGQGFGLATMYNGECQRDDNEVIVADSCTLKRFETEHQDSEVYIDYMHVYSRDQ